MEAVDETATGARTRLQYRGRRVTVHHGYLRAKDCPWPRGSVFTCQTCKRTICWCMGNDTRRCDECENVRELREALAAERKAAKVRP